MARTNAATALADEIRDYEKHTQETEYTDLDVVWALLERAEALLRETGPAAVALLSDIEEMRHRFRAGAYFGGFSVWEYDNWGDPDECVAIEWPNLAITAGRLAHALEPVKERTS